MSERRRLDGQDLPESRRKAVVSVSEMAGLCGLSRARFYELVGKGFFSGPKRDARTNRPFYDREGQDACLGVRTTNMGANGQPILFYMSRFARSDGARPRRSTGRLRPQATRAAADGRLARVVEGLKQLGLTSLTEASVQVAIRTTFPEGIAGRDDAEVLPPLFRLLLARRRSNSNGML